MGITLTQFTGIIQEQISKLPSQIQTEILNQANSIYNRHNTLDEDTSCLNDNEFANAQVDVNKLIEDVKAKNADKLQKPGFGVEQEMKDGSEFTELITERKQLWARYEELCELTKARAKKLGYTTKEGYFKDITDDKLTKMYDEMHQISDRRDAIYNEIEAKIKNSPVGTRFQCGEYIIAHKRAYTDSTGDRMLVFEKLD